MDATIDPTTGQKLPSSGGTSWYTNPDNPDTPVGFNGYSAADIAALYPSYTPVGAPQDAGALYASPLDLQQLAGLGQLDANGNPRIAMTGPTATNGQPTYVDDPSAASFYQNNPQYQSPYASDYAGLPYTQQNNQNYAPTSTLQTTPGATAAATAGVAGGGSPTQQSPAQGYGYGGSYGGYNQYTQQAPWEGASWSQYGYSPMGYDQSGYQQMAPQQQDPYAQNWGSQQFAYGGGMGYQPSAYPQYTGSGYGSPYGGYSYAPQQSYAYPQQAAPYGYAPQQNYGYSPYGAAQTTAPAPPVTPTDPTQTYVNALPAPNQISPQVWATLDPDTQQFLMSAYGAAGYSPTNVQWQIQQLMPGQAGTSGMYGGTPYAQIGY